MSVMRSEDHSLLLPRPGAGSELMNQAGLGAFLGVPIALLILVFGDWRQFLSAVVLAAVGLTALWGFQRLALGDRPRRRRR